MLYIICAYIDHTYPRNYTRDGCVLPSWSSIVHLPTPLPLTMLPSLVQPVWDRVREVGCQVACVHVLVFVRTFSSPAHTTSPLDFRPMTTLSSMEDIQHLIVQVSNGLVITEREAVYLWCMFTFVGPRICGKQRENCSYGFHDECFGPRGSHGSILTASFYTLIILQSLTFMSFTNIY